MAIYSLVALPHTPPPARGQKVTARQVLGLDALAMMKDRSYLVFVIASILACIPLTFYYSFTNAYLNDVGVVNAAGKMTLGQVSEVALMLLMPVVFRLLSVRGILLAGLLAWAVRYVLLGLRQSRARDVDVLRRHPAARHLLRLLLRHRPALHRPGGAGASAQHRAGLHHLRDLRRRHADRLAAVGHRARLLHHHDGGHRGPQLDRLLAQLGGDVVRDHAAGAAVLPQLAADRGAQHALRPAERRLALSAARRSCAARSAMLSPRGKAGYPVQPRLTGLPHP